MDGTASPSLSLFCLGLFTVLGLNFGLDSILWPVGGVVEVALDVGHCIKGAMLFCLMLEPQWSKRQGDAFTLQMQETGPVGFHLLLDS